MAAELRVSAERVACCRSLQELRGLEGAAAAAYWRGFGRKIRNAALPFHGRSRRPPRDPPNAMLSLGYTFLGILQQSHVLAAGLDPYVGVFHDLDYNRPSLVLDLIEEFRPVAVDALVLSMLNQRQVGPADFERPERVKRAEAISEGFEDAGEGEEPNAVYLAEGGRRVFLRSFFDRLREPLGGARSERRRSLREQMRVQVQEYAASLRGAGRGYEPFVWR